MTAAWEEHRYGPAAYAAGLDVARRRVERVRVGDHADRLTQLSQNTILLGRYQDERNAAREAASVAQCPP